MITKKNKEICNDIPIGISTTIAMDEPNQKVNIHNGNFSLSKGDVIIEIEGEVWFDWLPNINTKFKGLVKSSTTKPIDFFKLRDKFDLIIDGFCFGEAFITNTLLTGKIIEVGGEMNWLSVMGDRTIPVSKITFSIPNLRDFLGLSTKIINKNGGCCISKNRLILENQDYIIIIDKRRDYKKLRQLLLSKGGYSLLYVGEIEKKSGSITFEELNKLRHCLSTFLSFLNGYRCSPLFLQGVHEKKIAWTDYTGYTTGLFKQVHSWPQKFSIDGLNEMWGEFYELWSNEKNKDFLVSVIHWYTEGNSNSGFLEGSIIIIQTALELIYNWLIVEKKKIIHGKDGERISAANKIRLLLSQFNTNVELPTYFKNISSMLAADNEIHDEIDLFVQIRNSIVHSQEEKRKKLLKISNDVKYEAQQLGLWYIEIALLNILKFKGKYRNRCSGKLWPGEAEEDFK